MGGGETEANAADVQAAAAGATGDKDKQPLGSSGAAVEPAPKHFKAADGTSVATSGEIAAAALPVGEDNDLDAAQEGDPKTAAELKLQFEAEAAAKLAEGKPSGGGAVGAVYLAPT